MIPTPKHAPLAATATSGNAFVPYVTYALIGICVALFAAGFLLGGIESVVGSYGMRPLFIAFEGEWYRLLTSAFLHWSLLHIGFNMLVLFMIGPALERVLGHVRFIVLYLLAALGGAVASYCFSPVATASVGASGAIFGLMAALVVAGRQLRYDVTQVIVLLAINLAIGFLPGGGVDWRAHLGGLVVGAAVAAIFAYAPKQSMTLQIIGCVLVLLLLVGATAVRTQQLRIDYAIPDQTPVVTASQPSGTLLSGQVNDRSYSRRTGEQI